MAGLPSSGGSTPRGPPIRADLIRRVRDHSPFWNQEEHFERGGSISASQPSYLLVAVYTIKGSNECSPALIGMYVQGTKCFLSTKDADGLSIAIQHPAGSPRIQKEVRLGSSWDASSGLNPVGMNRQHKCFCRFNPCHNLPYLAWSPSEVTLMAQKW